LVLCNVEVSKPDADTAYERFTDQGPLAMLPLGGNRYACVWTQDPQLAEQAVAQSEPEFIAALQACFGLRLGFIERVGTRFSIPIERIRADRLQQQRCFLVGNAANALHPVAGQSFNLSLRDIACLYELLAEHPLSTLDDERLNTIASDYERLRVNEQQAVIRLGDGLVNLFSNNLPLFDTARAAGLSILDLLPPLKTQVALSGMGMTFGGNRLLRGHL
jgi:2-octaprenyl-6-methoxyphenol hydroxylase